MPCVGVGDIDRQNAAASRACQVQLPLLHICYISQAYVSPHVYIHRMDVSTTATAPPDVMSSPSPDSPWPYHHHNQTHQPRTPRSATASPALGGRDADHIAASDSIDAHDALHIRDASSSSSLQPRVLDMDNAK